MLVKLIVIPVDLGWAVRPVCVRPVNAHSQDRGFGASGDREVGFGFSGG